jgi:ribosomal protein S10
MKIQILIRSLDNITLSLYLNLLKTLLKNFKTAQFITYKMPVSRKKISLLKSPHIYKKAFEQFELKVHTVLIELKTQRISNMIMKFILINKPKNTTLKIKYRK